MISKNTIDKVFETARLEEVIGDFVMLKKSGSNFKGLSPFTEERTPSFMVSPVKQIWKDFSSGKGGNVIAFLMEHEHFTYPEAIKYLAKKYAIEIEETEQSDEQKIQASERESLYLVSEFAKDYFHKTLLHSEEGKAIGETYFKERGFTPETIKTFDLGYSPNSWDAFTTEALGKGYKLEFLEKTGLTIVKETKQFDRFRGRVIFPIQSMSGRVLGFGGRILTNDKKAAKYLNSPESDLYHKSKVLYGIYHAKQTIAKEDRCYLVEGYTDVIQFYQRGIKNVVASSGTALTSEQIRLVNRLTKNITVLFDGDAAGLRASLRGIDLILEQGMNVKVCAFPEGEDPDSFARSHSLEELTLFLEQESKDFISFKASLLVNETANDPVKKAETIREMVQSIAKIPDVIQREIYLQECARIMDINEEVLFNALAQTLSKDSKDRKRATAQRDAQPSFEVVSNQFPAAKKVDRQAVLESDIIKSLLLYGNKEVEFDDVSFELDENGETVYKIERNSYKVYEKIYLDLQEDEIEFAHENLSKVYYSLVETLNSDEEFKVELLVNRLEQEQSDFVSDILMTEEKHELSNWESKDIYVKMKEQTVSEFVEQLILHLRNELIRQKIDSIATDINSKNDEDRLQSLSDIVDYQKLDKVITQRLGMVVSKTT